MRVSCSIVTYHNAPEQVAQVLHSLCTTPVPIEIYLVDNSSCDALSAVARQFGARYIHVPANIGFGAAHNVAIIEAMTRQVSYHLVLNPDIAFDEKVIPALLAYMDLHPDIGLLMPGIHYPDGRRQHLCKLLPHPGDLIIRRFFPALYRLSGRLANYEMHGSGYDKIMEVPALSGCFMCLRASVLKKVGGFDERFFMYLEDVDLSRRIGQVARTVYYPCVSITHAYQKGSYRSFKLMSHHIKSAVKYFNKWGWFCDAERRAINRAAIQQIKGPLNKGSLNGQRRNRMQDQ